MDATTQEALTNAAQTYFQMVAAGDAASLQQNSIASLATNFAGIQNAIKENQPNLAGVKGTARGPFLLQATGSAPLAHAEFLCGVFGPSGQTAESAVFMIPNLPPGNYGIVTVDAAGSQGAYTVTFVLQQESEAWKVGGLYIKAVDAAAHDGKWFAQRADEFKAKGQTRNAWLYFQEARELLVPVPFMSTMMTDKLYDEAQSVKPADLPSNDAPMTLSAGGKSYALTTLFPAPVGNDLELIVKYQSPDISDTGKTYQDNLAVIKALLARYPEFRDAFDGVVARAVAPSGQDYGTMMPMKEIK
ncbi:MAG TPA: hypothetical protein VLV49_17200 [Terriglobales bacterium]|nr:hypothetical protein [Terriglobales bacterium]